jgi:hypothetical protein
MRRNKEKKQENQALFTHIYPLPDQDKCPECSKLSVATMTATHNRARYADDMNEINIPWKPTKEKTASIK